MPPTSSAPEKLECFAVTRATQPCFLVKDGIPQPPISAAHFQIACSDASMDPPSHPSLA